MPRLYLVTVGLHLLAAMVWLGGTFFLALVGAPVLRKVQPPSLRVQLFEALGVRFRRVGWAAIWVLLATGVAMMGFRGWLDLALLSSGAFWSSAAGRAFAVKLVAVTLMLALTAAHDFVLGPAAGRADPTTPEGARLRRRSALLARWGALLGLVVLGAAVALVRPG